MKGKHWDYILFSAVKFNQMQWKLLLIHSKKCQQILFFLDCLCALIFCVCRNSISHLYKRQSSSFTDFCSLIQTYILSVCTQNCSNHNLFGQTDKDPLSYNESAMPSWLSWWNFLIYKLSLRRGEFTSFTLRIRGSMSLQKTLFMHNCHSEEILPFTLSFSGSVNSSSKWGRLAHPTFVRSRK